jgi:hypothetical protein
LLGLSGLVNTARMVGATLGIAVLGALFAVHAGESTPKAMVSGLRLAYLGGALVELAGALVALAIIRADSMEQRKAPISPATRLVARAVGRPRGSC